MLFWVQFGGENDQSDGNARVEKTDDETEHSENDQRSGKGRGQHGEHPKDQRAEHGQTTAVQIAEPTEDERAGDNADQLQGLTQLQFCPFAEENGG